MNKSTNSEGNNKKPSYLFVHKNKKGRISSCQVLDQRNVKEAPTGHVRIYKYDKKGDAMKLKNHIDQTLQNIYDKYDRIDEILAEIDEMYEELDIELRTEFSENFVTELSPHRSELSIHMESNDPMGMSQILDNMLHSFTREIEDMVSEHEVHAPPQIEESK